MKNTIIEWAHHTVNFWWGCTKVSPACEHCYAETMAKLFSRGRASWGPSGARWLRDITAFHELQQLHVDAGRKGVRERVFVNSMSDTFEDRRDLDDARKRLFLAAELSISVDVLLLTKRPENIRRMVPPHWLEKWPAHVWVGTTVETQETADRRIPALMEVPAKVRFLSCEPLLGVVDLMSAVWKSSERAVAPYIHRSDNGNLSAGLMPGINWVICGGESGHAARPMDSEWALALRDQCADASVPFFFKQWGEWLPVDQDNGSISYGRHKMHVFSEDSQSYRVGKKNSARALDGVIHSAVPEVQ